MNFRSLIALIFALTYLVALPATAAIHCVEHGDTLTSIAAKTGHTVAELKAMNWLTGDVIRAGEPLLYIAPLDVQRAIEERELLFVSEYAEGDEASIAEEQRFRELMGKEIGHLRAGRILYSSEGSVREGVHFSHVISPLRPTRRCAPTYGVRMFDPATERAALDENCATRKEAEERARQYQRTDQYDREYSVVRCPPEKGCNPCAPP